MSHAPAALSLILLLGVVLQSPTNGGEAPLAPTMAEDPTPADPLASWALERFAEAGLDLPPVEIDRRDSKQSCGGNTAVAVHGGPTPRVILCADPEAPGVVVKRALLHELSHIWTDDELTDDDRAAFAEHRGCGSWTDGPWEERASEHAAEIITWALMDRELLILTVRDHRPAQLSEAYRLLTGTAPEFREVED